MKLRIIYGSLCAPGAPDDIPTLSLRKTFGQAVQNLYLYLTSQEITAGHERNRLDTLLRLTAAHFLVWQFMEFERFGDFEHAAKIRERLLAKCEDGYHRLGAPETRATMVGR